MFGPAGASLYAFVKAVDLDHPHTPAALNLDPITDQACADALIAGAPTPVSWVLSPPARLLKKRLAARRARKSKEWAFLSGRPEDFSRYARHAVPYRAETEAAGRQTGVLSALGCPALAAAVASDFDSFRRDHDVYYGFNRMSARTAALALAPAGTVRETPITAGPAVRQLDRFPPLGGRPLFDHFVRVSVGPRAVLLGERDQKCYFISEA